MALRARQAPPTAAAPMPTPAANARPVIIRPVAIIVTPRLVRPARPGDPLKTPTDNTLPGNDADFFLLGKGEIPRDKMRKVTGAVRPFSGHILDLPKGVANVVAVKN